MISFVTATILFLILTFGVNQFLLKILPHFFYLALMFPGVVIHESAHLISAVLTGTPVSEVNFFSRSGGHVIHQKPKIPVIGQLFISFAPLVLGFTLIYFISRQMPLELGKSLTIPLSTIKVPMLAPTGNWQYIDGLWLYLFLSISLTLTPSRQDIISSITGVIVAIALFALLYINKWLTISPELVALIWYINSVLALMLVFLWLISTLKKSHR